MLNQEIIKKKRNAPYIENLFVKIQIRFFDLQKFNHIAKEKKKKMEKEITVSNDLIEILPKNLSLLIFGFAFDVSLVNDEMKKNEEKKVELDLEENILRKQIEKEKQFCDRMVSLNNLKRINKNWKKYFESPLLWEKIFLHLNEEIENVNLPELPKTFSFHTFNKHMIKRSQALHLRIEESMYIQEECVIRVEVREDLDENSLKENYVVRSKCDINVQPRVKETDQKKNCGLF